MTGELARDDAVAVILSTAPAAAPPGKPGAHELAQLLLQERLCACVHVVPGVVSHFWWQGAIDRTEECLLVIKTTLGAVAALRQRLVALHPYDVPEVLVLPTDGGHLAYIEWVAACVSARSVPPAGGA